MIEQKAVEVDEKKIEDIKAEISTNKCVLLKVGKRRFAKVSFVKG